MTREEWKADYRARRTHGGWDVMSHPRISYKLWRDGKRITGKDIESGFFIGQIIKVVEGLGWLHLIQHIEVERPLYAGGYIKDHENRVGGPVKDTFEPQPVYRANRWEEGYEA